MVTVRPYVQFDWETIKGWWDSAGEAGPLPWMMPLDSSFVAEIDGVPALAVAVYLTNTPEIAYVDNFIGNPALKGADRQSAAVSLANYVASFVKQKGFRKLYCMTDQDALVTRYQALGFTPSTSGVTVLVRKSS